MKLYFLFAVMDFLILLAYPLVYLANRLREMGAARRAQKRG